MGEAATVLKRVLLFSGFALLAMVGLVLFAAVAVAVRPLLIVAAVLAVLGGLVLSCFSPAFREWFEAVGERHISHSGLRLATDVAVHPSHSWARISTQGVTVGADDLVQATLGPVETVELPPVGSHVKQGDPLFTLRRGSRSVGVRAPMSGTVVTTNETLLGRPELVNEEPFARGWAVRLRTDNIREDGRRLFRGKQARGWFRHEIDRLIAAVLHEEAVVPSLADGGILVDELYRQIDDIAWRRVTETFFDGP